MTKYQPLSLLIKHRLLILIKDTNYEIQRDIWKEVLIDSLLYFKLLKAAA